MKQAASGELPVFDGHGHDPNPGREGARPSQEVRRPLRRLIRQASRSDHHIGNALPGGQEHRGFRATPILNLKNLSRLSIIGFARLGDDARPISSTSAPRVPRLTDLELAYFGKATDAGLERLAGLKNLERFTFRSPVRGHAFAKFAGWTRLKYINFHSNGLDDQGLGHVCESFPNLEFIKLWHSKLLTDESAEHLKKLTRLKGIEISCRNATANLFKHIEDIPLEYAAFESGVNSPAAQVIENAKSVPTCDA